MDAHADICLTRGDTRQNSPAQSFAVDHEDGPGNTALKEDSVPGNLNPLPPNVSRG